MSHYRTISVEPAKMTLADKKTKEMAAEFIRMKVMDIPSESHNNVQAINLVLPKEADGLHMMKNYYLPLRTIFSALLVISGISMIIQGSSILVVFGSIQIFGALTLAIGLFSRITMAISAVLYAIAGIMALRSGMMEVSNFAMMFGAIVFSLCGSGQYSCDKYLRRTLFRKKRNAKRKKSEMALSYKAFSIAENI